jgi:hypothetical protein
MRHTSHLIIKFSAGFLKIKKLIPQFLSTKNSFQDISAVFLNWRGADINYFGKLLFEHSFALPVSDLLKCFYQEIN